MAERKVLVLGYPFDRRVELEGALNYNEQTGKNQRNCRVVFVNDANDALSQASDAHIIVANTEMCGDFFTKLVKDKDYKGQHFVPFAASSSQRSKGITGPDGKHIFPANYCGLNRVIMSKLAEPLFRIKTKQEEVAVG